MIYFNAHTHSKEEKEESVEQLIHLNPTDKIPNYTSSTFYSCGIHPWYITPHYEEDLEKLETILAHHSIAAIGECGLDKGCSTPLLLQEKVFYSQIQLGQKYHLPIIVHCVKAYDRLLALSNGFNNYFILHGYRGNKGLTQQLLNKNEFFFSLGHHYSTEALNMIPLDHLFLETDDSPLSIQLIYQQVAKDRNIPIQSLSETILANKKRVFSLR